MTPGKSPARWFFISLQFGAQNRLKQEDLTKIFAEFGDVDDDQRLLISLGLQAACLSYSSPDKRHRLTLSEHKRKLEQVAASSKKLDNLLGSHDLDAAKLVSPSNTPIVGQPEIGADGFAQALTTLLSSELSSESEAQRKWEVFREVLKSLSDEASAAALSTERLMSLRGSKSDKTRKSKERQYLWEPIFQLLVDAGRTVGFSPTGPLMRILKMIHAALSIDPPNPDAVRQAFREFKMGGVQPTKKRRSTPGV
jgi:hypothetical protein